LYILNLKKTRAISVTDVVGTSLNGERTDSIVCGDTLSAKLAILHESTPKPSANPSRQVRMNQVKDNNVMRTKNLAI
jgi:hypothetical protein